MNATNWFKKPIVWVAAAAVVVVLAVVSVWSLTNSVNNDGFRRQREVVQQYNQYQTSLSTCLDNTQLNAGIAQQEFSQIKDILTAAVSARYVDANGKSTNASAALGGGQFVSALQEQYPNIDTSVWKDLVTNAIGCRNQVAGVNDHLQAIAANFDTWTNTGGLFTRHVHNNWPNDQLRVKGLNGQVLTGQAALDFLTQPVLTSAATTAVQTHVMPDQSKDLFTNSPTK